MNIINTSLQPHPVRDASLGRKEKHLAKAASCQGCIPNGMQGNMRSNIFYQEIHPYRDAMN